MRRLATILCLSAMCVSASAQQRREEFTAPQRGNATAMSCQAVKAFIQSNGAALLSTGGGSYDRYVRDQSFCYSGQVGRTAFAPTRDNPHCFVGYTCEERQLNNPF